MHIFVISLPDAVDRRHAISTQLKGLGIQFSFFDAVDGRNGLPENYHSMVDKNRMQRRVGRMVSDGEIACALSHALLYKHICDNAIKHSVILEDDAICNGDFKAVLDAHILQNHPCGFIMLYHLYARILPWQRKSFFAKYEIAPLINTCGCTVAYYIDLCTAHSLYKHVFPIGYVADWFTDITALGAMATTPRLIGHNTDTSQLQQGRKSQQKIKQKSGIFGRFGWRYLVRYKLQKPFSVRISKTL